MVNTFARKNMRGLVSYFVGLCVTCWAHSYLMVRGVILGYVKDAVTLGFPRKLVGTHVWEVLTGFGRHPHPCFECSVYLHGSGASLLLNHDETWSQVC